VPIVVITHIRSISFCVALGSATPCGLSTVWIAVREALNKTWVCVCSVLMRACDGQRDWRLVNGFFKQSGCYCVLFSFCDTNATTETTTFQYTLTHDHIPVDMNLRSAPVSFIFTHKPLMVRLCVWVRCTFSSVYLCYLCCIYSLQEEYYFVYI